MAFVEGNVVKIPAVSANAPPNPLLGYDEDHTAPPSPAAPSSGAVTQSTLTHRLLLHDQRCLVTGAVSTQIRAFHLIKTVPVNESNQEKKRPLKEEVVGN